MISGIGHRKKESLVIPGSTLTFPDGEIVPCGPAEAVMVYADTGPPTPSPHISPIKMTSSNKRTG